MNNRFKEFQNLKSGCTTITSPFYIFLYGLISYLAPKNIVEIGTNFGLSSIIMALALKENNIDGHIYTFDIKSQYLSIAEQQIKQMQLQDKITLIFGTSTNVKAKKLKYDFAFIDGDHSYEGAKKDFENLKNISNCILFHDAHNLGVIKVLQEAKEQQIKLKFSPTEQIVIWRKQK